MGTVDSIIIDFSKDFNIDGKQGANLLVKDNVTFANGRTPTPSLLTGNAKLQQSDKFFYTSTDSLMDRIIRHYYIDTILALIQSLID